MAESLRDRSLTGFLWVLVDKVGSSLANFIVTIILARLLAPADFGLVAMVMVFFEISSSFIQSGIGFALVREKTITELDKSTVFIFNLVTALVFYGLLYFAAPYIARFFEQPVLTAIVRIMGINLIISALAIIQHAVLTQQIDFRVQTKVRMGAVLASGICAVAMALNGWGVWSLIARIGVMELITTVLFWVINPWRLTLRFSTSSFRRLFGFGSVILAEALIDKVFRHLLQILIGKFYSAATLGFFTQANNFCNMASNSFLQAIQKVTYPVLARLQDDKVKLKDGYRQLIGVSSFIIIPVMALMGVLAEPLIVSLAGEKWLPSVPLLRLLCLGGAIYHLNAINLDVLLVLGRVDLSLKLEVIKKVILAVALIIGIQFGIYGMVIGQVAATYIALFINTYYSDLLLRYALAEQMKDVAPTVLFSLGTGAVVFILLQHTNTAALYQLLWAPVVGTGIYLTLHHWAKTREMALIKTFIIPKTIGFFTPKL